MLLYVPDALDVLVPLAVAWTAVLAVAAPRLAETTSPKKVVRLLTAAAVSVTLSLGAAAAAVILVLLARVPMLATWGRWAQAALPEPAMSWWWALPLAVVVLILIAAGARHLIDVARQLWLAQHVCRAFGSSPAARLGEAAGQLMATSEEVDAEWVVVDDDVPEAYAVPWELRLERRWPWRRRAHEGRPALQRGQIVVSRGMLEVLTPGQQRVLLEHERAHLRCRHYLWVQLNEVAAVLNPVLRHTPALVRAAAERDADLEAATRVGDATLTARAIAAAALARSNARHRSIAPARPLQATGGDVVRRVEYLLSPRALSSRSGRLSAVILCVIIALAGLTSAGTLYSLTARLQHAQQHDTTVSVTTPPATAVRQPEQPLQAGPSGHTSCIF